MKRIATIGAVVTAFAVAPSVAGAGNHTARAHTQVSTQVAQVQIAHVQVAHVQVANVSRANTAIIIQRHQVQVAHAKRFVLLARLHIR
jgi:hypothetical protein